MDWIRNGSTDLTPADIVQACDDSLQRLQTDVIDLYQIHWPNRNAPAFGALYFDPAKDRPQTSIHEQLQALAGAGAGRQGAPHRPAATKRPGACASSCALAEQHGLPRVVSVQNPYALVNRALDNGAGRGAAPQRRRRCWPIRRWASAR